MSSRGTDDVVASSVLMRSARFSSGSSLSRGRADSAVFAAGADAGFAVVLIAGLGAAGVALAGAGLAACGVVPVLLAVTVPAGAFAGAAVVLLLAGAGVAGSTAGTATGFAGTTSTGVGAVGARVSDG